VGFESFGGGVERGCDFGVRWSTSGEIMAMTSAGRSAKNFLREDAKPLNTTRHDDGERRTI
jgi:hypothetical protein